MRAVLCIALFFSLALAQEADLQKLFEEAVKAQQRGDFALAVRDYQRLLQLQPNSPDIRANLGAALVRLGRFDEAIANYKAALKLDSGNKAIQSNLGLAFFKKGDFELAASQFEELHKADPQNTNFTVLLAQSYLQMGRYQEVVTLLSPLEGAQPDNLDTLYTLGSALLNTGDAGKGAALLEHVGKEGHSAEAYMMAGSALFKNHDYERARPDLEMALQLNPNLPGLYTLVGMAEEQGGNKELAEKYFRVALTRNGNDLQAILHLAGVLYEKRDLEGANLYIGKALELDPSSLFAVYLGALLKSKTGDLESAVKGLEKVTQADPGWLQPHIELAALYYKLHRSADGQRERAIVDRLMAIAGQQKREEDIKKQQY
jgi:tetratricopeptide (TPR) repeat protein